MIFIFFNVIIILGDNMKKGFTLIELLGVIVILGILSLIAIPIIDRTLNQGKDNLYEVQKEQLIKALKNYYAENVSVLNSLEDGMPTCMTVRELKNLGYLPTDLKNPKTNEDLDESLEVCIKKELTYECGEEEMCVRDTPKYTYFIEEVVGNGDSNTSDDDYGEDDSGGDVEPGDEIDEENDGE